MPLKEEKMEDRLARRNPGSLELITGGLPRIRDEKPVTDSQFGFNLWRRERKAKRVSAITAARTETIKSLREQYMAVATLSDDLQLHFEHNDHDRKRMAHEERSWRIEEETGIENLELLRVKVEQVKEENELIKTENAIKKREIKRMARENDDL
jgi:hypothetical protein